MVLSYGYLSPKVSSVSYGEKEIIKEDLEHTVKVTERGYVVAKAKLAQDFGTPDNTFGQVDELMSTGLLMRWVVFYHLGTQAIKGGGWG